MEKRRQPTQQEIDLRERAARHGYKLRRRGTEYHFTSDDGSGFGAATFEGAAEWFETVIVQKTPMQISSASGIPLFKINDPETL
jgi:hypothetical protein